MKIGTVLLGLTAVLLVLSSNAFGADCSAGCTEYLDEGEVQCTGSGGCVGYHELEFCSFGCTCGQCFSHGGSGECCGKIYYTPVIYPQGGDCSNECGGAPQHARSHLRRRQGNHNAELHQNRTPGLIMLGPNTLYREPLFAYVFNRCSNSYLVVAE